MSDSDRHSLAWKTTPSDYLATRPKSYAISLPKSLYLTMSDGTRLALDYYLPTPAEDTPEKFPVIAIMTPYYRRFKTTEHGAEDAPNIAIYRDFFVARGYALVVLDVRGSGASFGRRDAFRSPTERSDYLELAQWISTQTWCNGSIGATGISYLGAASCFLGSTGHPAVKAIAPLFAVFDTYADHVFPGGIMCKTVTANYDDLIRALDLDLRDELKQYPYFADPRYAGPAPVDADTDDQLLAHAVQQHRDNFNLRDMAPELAYREEPVIYDPHLHSGSCSPYWYLSEVADKVAVYSVSGWYDGSAFVHGSVSRYLTLKGRNDRLLLGPWDHGARTNGSPWRTPGTTAPEFPLLAEILRFFDYHLAGIANGLENEDPVHYFCTHDEAWKTSPTWPPASTAETWYLTEQQLAPCVDHQAAHRSFQTDFTLSCGTHSRFERLSAQAITDYYSDWLDQEAGMCSWTSAPLETNVELSGHALLQLEISSNQADGALFVYLSELEADGQLRFITDGCLRLSHRATQAPPARYQTAWPFRDFSRAQQRCLEPNVPEIVQIPLLPCSWQLRAGSRLKVSLSGADAEHFVQVPHGRPPHYTVLTASGNTWLRLPAVR